MRLQTPVHGQVRAVEAVHRGHIDAEQYRTLLGEPVHQLDRRVGEVLRPLRLRQIADPGVDQQALQPTQIAPLQVGGGDAAVLPLDGDDMRRADVRLKRQAGRVRTARVAVPGRVGVRARVRAERDSGQVYAAAIFNAE